MTLLLLVPPIPYAGGTGASPPPAGGRGPIAQDLSVRAGSVRAYGSGSNFTWDPTSASPLPVSADGVSGMGLSAMASEGPTTLLFGSHRVGSSFVSYTRLYSEANNTWWTVGGAMPPSLSNFSLTGDSVFEGGSALLFGGENTSTYRESNATWAFSFTLSSWQRIPAKTAPAARFDTALASDPATGTLVLIGGWNASAGTLYSGLWELNLSAPPYTWTDAALGPAILPGHTREFGASLAATGAHRFLLFGGCTDSPSTACTSNTVGIHLTSGAPTYSYNATSGPGVRAFASWAWDPAQGVALLYGGEDLTVTPALSYSDSWEYVPGHNYWVSETKTPTNAPSSRYFAAATWVNVSSNGTLLVTGGVSAAPPETTVWRFSPTLNLTVFVNDTLGRPVAGALVSDPVGGSLWSATTNSTGVANLLSIPSGPALLTAQLYPPYHNATAHLHLLPATNAHAALVLTPLPELAVRTWSDRSGRLTPLGGTALEWNSSLAPYATTSPSGWYNQTVGHSGPVHLNATRSGYGTGSNFTVIPYTGVVLLNVSLKPNLPAALDVHLNTTGGASLPGAYVNVTNLTGENLTTDAHGYANFTNLNPGGLIALVSAWMGDHYRNSSQVYLPPGGTAYLNLTLFPFPVLVVRTWERAGTLVLPLPGATLFANTSTSGSPAGTTGSGGWWNVSLPHGGPIFFNASKPGFGNAPTNHTTLPYTGTAFLNLTLNVSYVELVVHVRNASGANLYLAGVTVFDITDPTSNTTNAWGYANFTREVPGPITVDTGLVGYYSNTSTSTLPANRTSYLNVTLVPWPSLHVFVQGEGIPGAPTLPLPNASVSRNATLLGLTGTRGWLNLSRTNPGLANVSASLPGYYPSYRTLSLNHTGTLNVSLTLVPVKATLHIHVLTPSILANGQPSALVPLPGAQVNVSNLGGGAQSFANTNLSGWANLTLDQGNYSVSAWMLDYQPVASQGPLLVGNVTVQFLIYRIPGATVSVLVHDRNTSLPIASAGVFLSLSGDLYSNSTGSDGWATLWNAWPPGLALLQVTATGYSPNSTRVTLRFREVVPEVLVNLTPLHQTRTGTNSTSTPFSLVPPQEQTLWWPFLMLPLIFVLGAVILLAVQRSSRRSATT